MAAYVIVDVEIFDIEQYLHYQHAIRPVLADAGARYLARGGEIEVLDGDYQPNRLILIEFPSLQAAREFYRSPVYQTLEPQRKACSRSRRIALQGL